MTMKQRLQRLLNPRTMIDRRPSPPTTEALSTTPPQRCRLLELPAELRNAIYELVLQEEEVIELAHLPIPALAATCHQIQQECIPMYFSINRFSVTLVKNNDRFTKPSTSNQKWLKELSLARNSHIRELHIAFRSEKNLPSPSSPISSELYLHILSLYGDVSEISRPIILPPNERKILIARTRLAQQHLGLELFDKTNIARALKKTPTSIHGIAAYDAVRLAERLLHHYHVREFARSHRILGNSFFSAMCDLGIIIAIQETRWIKERYGFPCGIRGDCPVPQWHDRVDSRDVLGHETEDLFPLKSLVWQPAKSR